MIGSPLRVDDAGRARLSHTHPGPLIAALLLAIFGLLTIHSASAELASSLLPRQATFLALGLICLGVVFLIDYHRLIDLAPFLYAGALVLLVLTLFIGHEVKGARSWLLIGPMRLQPAEFTKLATALLLARVLARGDQPYLDLRRLLQAGAIVAVPALLIAAQNDLGSTAMFAAMAATMVLVAGVRPRLLAALVLLGAIGAGLFWQFGMQPYQRSRIVSFLNAEQDPLGAGYQVRQSKIAVGSGMFWGRGYLQGTQSQLRFLPERSSDFIMAVLAEEWGFAGVAVVLGLYGLYIGSGVRIALRSRDRLGMLLVAGLLALFSFHVLYNTAMVVGLLPITGIPLPFLSHGGSFMMMNFLAVALILGIDHRRYVNR
ncbi:MAG: rod shape-determining protein RodA [Acidobacteriota bacterium]